MMLIIITMTVIYISTFLFSAFWLKDDVIYEQPSVTYRYYTIVELHGLRYAYAGDICEGIMMKALLCYWKQQEWSTHESILQYFTNNK